MLQIASGVAGGLLASGAGTVAMLAVLVAVRLARRAWLSDGAAGNQKGPHVSP